MKNKPIYLSAKLGFIGEFGENEKPVSDIEILRVGTLYDRNLTITQEMLNDMVKHFNENVVGQELSVNKDHSAGEACGWIKNVYLVGDVLFATVEWTWAGYHLIKDELYKYVSIEFFTKYPRATDGQKVNNVVTGLALTNTPALKNQKALSLSEQNNYLTQTNMFEKLLAELLAKDTVLEADYSLAETLMADFSEEEKLGHKENMEALKAKMAKCKKDMEDLEKAEKEKLSAMNTNKVTLAKVTEENIQLAERVALLEADKRKMELSVKADAVILSETKQVGLPTAKKDEAIEFMATLSDEQVEKFISLMSSLQSYEAGTKGEAVVAKDTDGKNSDVEARLSALNAEADKICKETGRPRQEVLEEITPKYYA